MIDFAKITKTLDGFDCHYFGTRESFGSMIHVFGVFNPTIGVAETQYDADGRRLKFENGEWVISNATHYQIIKPRRWVQVTRWLCFAYMPALTDDPFVVHILIREPSADEIARNKYVKVEKQTWNLEVPE